MMRVVATLLCALQCVHGFAAGPVVDARWVMGSRGPRSMPSPSNERLVVSAVRQATLAQSRSAAAPQMGLFGMGGPELAIIAGVALLILGPDQVKSMAKEVGKVSAELKQVPEEFNKGMSAGQQELEARKAETLDASDAEVAPPAPPPPTPPA